MDFFDQVNSAVVPIHPEADTVLFELEAEVDPISGSLVERARSPRRARGGRLARRQSNDWKANP